ncbi:hypothetical protein M885DRAFT_508637 [Pelagophyceae sp. CCMP2097]|nr:hypothetical protein M885DRAFT_508637 [Pelagophyceae sp. CCMP2097]
MQGWSQTRDVAQGRSQTREVAQMRGFKKAEAARVYSASSFLRPRQEDERRNAWIERDARRADQFVSAHEQSAQTARRRAAVAVRRAKIEALHAGEVAQWTAELAPWHGAAEREAAQRGRYAELVHEREQRQRAEREVAQLRLDQRRLEASPAVQSASRLAEAHSIEVQRVDDAALRPPHEPDAPPGTPFVAAEQRPRDVAAQIGFSTDGSIILSSAVRRRDFVAGLVSVLRPLAPAVHVDVKGLDVVVDDDGAQLVATVSLRAADRRPANAPRFRPPHDDDDALEAAIDALGSAVSAPRGSAVVVDGVAAEWFQVTDRDERETAAVSAARYRADLDALVRDKQSRDTAAADETSRLDSDLAARGEATESFLQNRDASDLEDRRIKARDLHDQLLRDADAMRQMRLDARADDVAAERLVVEAAARANADDAAAAAAQGESRAAQARQHGAAVRAQAGADAAAAAAADREFEATEAWAYWDARDRDDAVRQEASRRLRLDVEVSWAAQRDDRRATPGGEAEEHFMLDARGRDAGERSEAELRAELWAAQQRQDTERALAEDNFAAMHDRAAAKADGRARDVAADREAWAEHAREDAWLRARAPALPPHLQGKLPASLRPATAGPHRTHAEATREAHMEVAAGRPLTAAAQQARERGRLRGAW